MFRASVCVLCLLMMCCVLLSAEQPAAAAANAAVPPMVKFSGVLTDVNGKPLPGIVGVTFSLYKDSEGGAPLWMETQNVQADKTGHYSVMLGSTSSHGLPGDLFMSGEARWLGVQAQEQAEGPRTVLVSVPYALKALDAETVGGRPASAFVAASASGSGTNASPAVPQANEIRCASGTACKTRSIPVFTSNGGSARVSSSIMSQDTATNIKVTGTQTVTGNISSGGVDVVSGGHISVGGSRVLSCTRSCGAIGSIGSPGISLYSAGSVATPAGYSLTGCSAYWASDASCAVIQYPDTANITALDDGAGACHALGFNHSGGTLESCACVTACQLP
jgi:hypothetical protein